MRIFFKGGEAGGCPKTPSSDDLENFCFVKFDLFRETLSKREKGDVNGRGEEVFVFVFSFFVFSKKKKYLPAYFFSSIDFIIASQTPSLPNGT